MQYNIYFFLRDGGNIETRPPLFESLTKIEKVIESSADLKCAELIASCDHVSDKIFGSVQLRFCYLNDDLR